MNSPYIIKNIFSISLLSALYLGSVTAVVAELPTGRVFLKNGNKLRGQAIGIDENQNLSFASDKLTQKALFPIEEIIALTLDKKAVPLPVKVLARIELNNRYNQPYGDVLIGSLKEFSAESIILETSYAGLITLRKSMVKSCKIMTPGQGHFYGPNNLNEWERPDQGSSWLFQEGSLLSKYRDDIIGKKVGMHSVSHISFELSYEENFQVGLMLFSDSPASFKPSFGSYLTLGRSAASLDLIGNAQALNQVNRNTSRASYQVDTMKQSMAFEIFVNAEEGSYYIYIDGQQAANIQSTPLEIDDSRGGLSFINRQSSPIKIKDLSIQPWDGNLPDSYKDKTSSTSPHNITLNNGDQVPGTVGKIEDTHMVVDTKYAPIKIPLHRIRSFSLEKSGEQPIMKQGDVCVWLQNGGHLTLKPTSITEEKITGYGQAFGELEINLSDLSRIDFNIYDDALKPDRAMAH